MPKDSGTQHDSLTLTGSFSGGTFAYGPTSLEHEVFSAIVPLAPWIVLLFALLVFRKPVASLINRINAAKTLLGDFEAPMLPQMPVTGADLSNPPVHSSIADTSVNYSDDVRAEVLEASKPQLESSAGGPSDPAQVPTATDLQEALAKVEIERNDWATAWGFERLYSELYGSQMTLLIYMSKRSNGRINPNNARQFLDQAKMRGNTDSFDKWLDVLLKSSLIGEVGSGPTEGATGLNYVLTDKGRAFLKYLSKEHPAFQMRPM